MNRYLLSFCLIPALASLSSCASSDNERAAHEQVQIMGEKTAECKKQFPSVRGNYERRAICESSALYDAGSRLGISYEAINELANTMKRLGAELDAGTITREDANMQLGAATHKAYAHAASDQHMENLELREHQEHCSSLTMVDGVTTTDCSP